MSAPSFLCRPERVKGMPIRLDKRALAAETPNSLFHENPPLFISLLCVYFYLKNLVVNQTKLTYLNGKA